LVGLAAPFAQAALKSSGEVEKLIERLATETRAAMFGVGAKNIPELKRFTLQRVR
jgi:isopentenyl diphosphate isomerase/L-lactate dehydrogenase-like FMN-dependent dehydrogenase